MIQPKCLFFLTSAAITLASVLSPNHISNLDLAEQYATNTIPDSLADDYFSVLQTELDDGQEGHEIDCDDVNGLYTDDMANSTLGSPPGMMKIAFGTQWKKGLHYWVAFPQLGLVSCKKAAVLGRKVIGKKHVRPRPQMSQHPLAS